MEERDFSLYFLSLLMFYTLPKFCLLFSSQIDLLSDAVTLNGPILIGFICRFLTKIVNPYFDFCPCRVDITISNTCFCRFPLVNPRPYKAVITFNACTNTLIVSLRVLQQEYCQRNHNILFFKDASDSDGI